MVTMKIKRFIVFTGGLTIGYLAGSAAGRERFEQIRSGAAAMASDLGLTRVSQQLRLRSGDLARASVDVVAETTCDGIDNAADRLEALLTPTDLHMSSFTEAGPDPVPSELARAKGSHHTRHKGKRHR
jgi:hypothetical protein